MALPDIVIEHGRPSKTARNEVRKLSGTWLNGLSVALIAAGIIVPLITFYPAYTDHALGLTNDPDFDWKLFRVCWISGGAFIFAMGFHIRALFIVRRLED
jgi:hypothetical protein